MPESPNVLLLMADQHRGDALGVDPACPRGADDEPVVDTPNLNWLTEDGTLFERAYSPAPSCIPARRCLWTGQTPATNGCPNWTTEAWEFEHTLAGELQDAGYHTGMVGHIHSHPPRNHIGFERLVHDKLDYSDWLEQQTDGEYDVGSHGVDTNSWDARPSHLPEHLERTRWTTERALDFLDRRDPTRPFFLNVSYTDPHPPFDPPQTYWDRYVDRELPDPAVGDWAADYLDGKLPDQPNTSAWCADLSDRQNHRARAGYYGLVTFIDHQVNRLVNRIWKRGDLDDTVVLYTADHGEMLGDHYLRRKTYAYEGSARVPFVFRFPDGVANPASRVERPVGLEDVMPTILDAAGVSIPDSVEGRSVLPLVEGTGEWRNRYHGEHGPIYHGENATQYLVGERFKYVWNPVTGDEQLFDLERDPLEETDLSDDPGHAAELEDQRAALVERLRDRPEGFVEDGTLTPTALEFWG